MRTIANIDYLKHQQHLNNISTSISLIVFAEVAYYILHSTIIVLKTNDYIHSINVLRFFRVKVISTEPGTLSVIIIEYKIIINNNYYK